MKRIIPGRKGKMHMYVSPVIGRRPTLCNMNGNTHTDDGWVDCKRCLMMLGYAVLPKRKAFRGWG